TYNHYRVVSKIAKEYETHFGGRRLKGNMDVEIAVDALDISPHIDHLILFTGDGDFRRLIEAIQDKGRRVTVVSSLRTQPMMLSDALRRQADNFIDLADIKESISRPASYAVQYPHQHSA
ncbi:NYN domain-containing protein, partial [Camelimonas fluminis]|uniref:NYN domain-containing protein n=1 Tax=Camelimonas fluminis TaxID=1576911 RepID=UPI00174AD8EB